MLSKIVARILPMLLIFVSVVSATAPGWVASGVVLEYSMDSDTVTFTVTERTSTEVKVDIKTENTYKAKENASSYAGQFWFDNSLLEGASKNEEIEDYKVTDLGKETYAGKEWDTITLEGTVSGARTFRTYDIETGLMLKQTVSQPGAPVVTLNSYTIPDFGTSEPEEEPEPEVIDEPEETPEPEEQPEPEGISEPVEEEAEEPDVVAPPQEESVGDVIADEETEDEEESKSCLTGAILLTLLGFVFVKR